jgi:hypothetical protein
MMAAERAATLIGEPAQGEKEAALGAVSTVLNIPPKTLRSYLVAWRFVRSLDTARRRKAATMPAVALEIIARWHLHDPSGAMRAIEAYAAGQYTVRSLLAAETAARPQRSELGGRRLEQIYREEIEGRLGSLETIWPRPSRPLYFADDKAAALPNPSGKADLVKPFRYRKDGPNVGKSGCAIMIVGPYTVTELYKRRSVDWCLRALGLTFFHDHVALVLPGSVARRTYISVLEAADAPRSRITLLRDPGQRNWRKLRCRRRR